MNFLDDMSPHHRQKLIDASTRIDIARNQHLVRRGEPGGDLFVVADGELQVVDTRTRPATIIAVMGKGDTIGEIAFIDHAPRSADVRAAEDSGVLHWTREDVNDLVDRSPELGVELYRSLCRISVKRLRNLTQHSVTGTLQAAASQPPGARMAEHEAGAVAVRLKRGLREAETTLRAAPDDEDARAVLIRLLDRVQADARRIQDNHRDRTSRDLVMDVWRNELHPWIVRSALADQSLRRARVGSTASPAVLSHVLNGEPAGDGIVGELLDSWLLERPTLRGLRALRTALAETGAGALPDRRGRRILVLNAGIGSVVKRLIDQVSSVPTLLTVADPSRDALGVLDKSEVPRSVTVSAIREDLAALATAPGRHALPPQDVAIVTDLLPYLPDRLAVSHLRGVGTMLAEYGLLIASALLPSADQALLDLLLDWPAIRRTPESLFRLGAAAGLEMELDTLDGVPAAVLRARPTTATRQRSPTPLHVASPIDVH